MNVLVSLVALIGSIFSTVALVSQNGAVSGILSEPWYRASPGGLVSFIIVIAIFTLGTRTLKLIIGGGSTNRSTRLRILVLTILFSLAFGVSQIIGTQFHFYDGLGALINSPVALIDSVITFIGYSWLGFLLSGYCLAISTKNIPPVGAEGEIAVQNLNTWVKGNRTPSILICFCSILSIRLAYWIWAFPGPISPDSVWQIAQIVGSAPWTINRPVGSTLMMATVIWPLYRLVGVTVATGIAGLVQVLASTAIITYTLKRMYAWGVPFQYILVLFGYFALFPLHSIHAITVSVDAQFGFSFLLYLVTVIDLVRAPGQALHNRRWVILFMVSQLGVILARHNGLYIVIPTAIAIIIRYRKYWQPLLAATVFPIAIARSVTAIVPNQDEVRGPSSLIDGTTLFVRQIARTSREHAGQFTATQREFVSKLFSGFSPEQVGATYNPVTSDVFFLPGQGPVRVDTDLVAAQPLWYLRGWADLGWNYAGTYLEAIVASTYRWFFATQNWIDTTIVANFGLFEPRHGMMGRIAGGAWGEIPLAASAQLWRAPVLGLPWAAAFWTWAAILAFAVLLVHKYFRDILLITGVPLVFLWLTAVAGPVNGMFRYIYPFALIVPIILVVGLFGWRNVDNTAEYPNVTNAY